MKHIVTTQVLRSKEFADIGKLALANYHENWHLISFSPLHHTFISSISRVINVDAYDKA